MSGPCGDTMGISLKVRDKKIVNAGFWNGYGATTACGSMTTEMAKGKTIEEALGIGQKEILEALEGLPEDHIHCALLAANTLGAAIEDYLPSEKEPWGQAYKRESMPLPTEPVEGKGESGDLVCGRSEPVERPQGRSRAAEGG